ncbi:RusA family crossover junction endodeoxyribonuclease [Candidatus Sumerlaeota bacterium]|nr:RusA family crossover junction endodeoxyribonuclease [Candidatus Sumerlaeota bacterium]
MITDGTYLELKANFFVEGIPKPQPRQRHFARKTKDGKIIQGCYTPQTGVKEWRERIYWEAKSIRQNNPEMFPLSGPIGLKLIFLFPRLKSLPRRTAHLFIPETSVPDLDNLIKAVQDALIGVLFANDARIVMIEASKWWIPSDLYPGVRIEIFRVLERENQLLRVILREKT